LHPKVFGQDTRATLFSIAWVRVDILRPDMQATRGLIREGDEALDAIDLSRSMSSTTLSADLSRELAA